MSTLLTVDEIAAINEITNRAMSDYANMTEGNFESAEMESIAESGEQAKLTAQDAKTRKAIVDWLCDRNDPSTDDDDMDGLHITATDWKALQEGRAP